MRSLRWKSGAWCLALCPAPSRSLSHTHTNHLNESSAIPSREHLTLHLRGWTALPYKDGWNNVQTDKWLHDNDIVIYIMMGLVKVASHLTHRETTKKNTHTTCFINCRRWLRAKQKLHLFFRINKSLSIQNISVLFTVSKLSAHSLAPLKRSMSKTSLSSLSTNTTSPKALNTHYWNEI